MAQVGMDYYEDMFKEITKKFYGEDDLESTETFRMMQNFDGIEAFSLAALMQGSLPSTSLITTPGLLEASIEAEENKWVLSDEVLPWTTSKIASYNAAQKLFRCNECESISFLSRIAEHWLGTHANLRVFQCLQCPYASAWARCVRMHLARQHNVCIEQNTDSSQTLWKENPVLEEVTKYLQRLKQKVEGDGPTIHATAVEAQPVKTEVQAPVLKIQNSHPSDQSIQTVQLVQAVQVPHTQLIKQDSVQTMVAPVKQEVNQMVTSQSKMQNHEVSIGTTPQKRYNCTFCPYATDRRDLYTRHENIHKEEKPFQCYICTKQFNRADHVKKHFLRMHREHPYDINRIRREVSKSSGSQTQYFPKPEATQISLQIPISQLSQLHTVTDIQHVLNNGLAIPTSIGLEKTKLQVQRPKRPGEKRYTCCYCSWSGVDNWCLKRHLNTHTKPFSCGLCEYKAARAERLATHVHKVHNKRACGRCSFLADDQAQLMVHQQQQHHPITERYHFWKNLNLNPSLDDCPTEDSSSGCQKVLTRNGPPDLIPILHHPKSSTNGHDMFDGFSNFDHFSNSGSSNEVTLKCNHCSFSTATVSEIASHNCAFKNHYSQSNSTSPESFSREDFMPVQTILEEVSDSNQSEVNSVGAFNFKLKKRKPTHKIEGFMSDQTGDKNNNKVYRTLARQLKKKLESKPGEYPERSKIVRLSSILCKKIDRSCPQQKFRVMISGKKFCINFKAHLSGKLRCPDCQRVNKYCRVYQNPARLLLHGFVAHEKYLRVL
nr:PREDICTED: putative zinc finger protein 840 isoform X1 [Bemisia tabaci]XP_018906339.1 PREDICTED: putative zinc finger protein 840 isoform X1 [Bemisia tabaci]